MEEAEHSTRTPPIERSDSSSASSVDHSNDPPTQTIHAPVPKRPQFPSRKSSGTIIVPRDSAAVGPVETRVEPNDVRAMSPRRTSEDLEVIGQEARNELQKSARGFPRDLGPRANGSRHAKALQDSLLTIFHRIEAVKEEHDKLDNNNKFLQKYIGDLMSTSKITASGGRGKK